MQSLITTKRHGRSDPRTRLLNALSRERKRRLAAIGRYDRYIAEAAGDLVLQAFWRNLRRQDVGDAQGLKNRLDREEANRVR